MGTLLCFLLQVEAALIYDAVHLLKASLQELKTGTFSDLNTSVEYLSDTNVPTCDDLDSWIFGSSLVNIMKVVSTHIKSKWNEKTLHDSLMTHHEPS